MTERTNPWAAEKYQDEFNFVSDYGRDVVRLLNPQRDEKILDLGCGTGQLTAEIAKSGAFVTGIDIDSNMLRTARRNYPQLHFLRANGHNFQVQYKMDAIFSNAALQWMTRPSEVIKCVALALKSDGRFVAEMGGHGNIQIIKDALKKAMQEEGITINNRSWPWFFPTPEIYGDLLKKHSFIYNEVSCFERPTRLESGTEGLRRWLEMFAVSILAKVPVDRVETVIKKVETQTRDELFHNGYWYADYVRLRFIAIRTTSP